MIIGSYLRPRPVVKSGKVINENFSIELTAGYVR